jgi:uncharacterized protein YkuJ
MATRDELHRLVSSLPEEALLAAHAALTHFQTWPPPELAEVEKGAEEMERRMRDRIERMRESGGGGGVGSFSLGTGASSVDRGRRQRARYSSGFERDGEVVHESVITHDAHEFTLLERISGDQHQVTFTLELTGPDGTTARHEHRYTVG